MVLGPQSDKRDQGKIPQADTVRQHSKILRDSFHFPTHKSESYGNCHDRLLAPGSQTIICGGKFSMPGNPGM